MTKYLEKYNKLVDKIKLCENSDMLKNLQEEFNNTLNKHINMLSRKEFINEIKNGSNKYSFGEIKMMFENIAPILFTTSKGREIIKKYGNTIKENKILLNLFLIQENIIQPKNIENPKSFITESFDLIGKTNKKILNENLSKLLDVLCEGLNIVSTDNTSLAIDKDIKEVNNAIDYLATNNKTLKNIVEHTNKINLLTNFITSRLVEENKNNNNVDIDELATQMLEAFNQKYDDKISVNESEIIKSIITSNDKKDVFEGHKNDCLNILENVLNNVDEETKHQLSDIQERIKNKMFNENTATIDIANFIELKETLKEE